MSLVLLICEDEPGTQKTLSALFSPHFEVLVAGTGKQGFDILEKRAVDIVITDNMMPEMTGLDLIKQAKPLFPQTSFILMTAFGNLDQAVEAIKSGAEDYILKPFELADIEHRVEKIKKFKSFESSHTAHKEDTVGVDRIIGVSPKTAEQKNFITMVADAPSSVLLLGPSGSGKEVMAKAIHESGKLKEMPFVSVNCACLTENFLESELFGHEKGAFTGAVQNKIGKFELAKGGTIFLDEIGELPLALQGKLLRVLQEREFYRLGSNRLLKTTARVVAATNRSLKDMVAAGAFREDLYFRLNVLTFELDPLEKRKEDVPLLINYFMQSLGNKFNKIIDLSDEVRRALESYPYPGNVRELQNIIERLMVLTPHRQTTRKDALPFSGIVTGAKPRHSPISAVWQDEGLVNFLEHLERTIIEEAMTTANGNQIKAADQLKIHRGTLQYKLKKYKIGEGTAA